MKTIGVVLFALALLAGAFAGGWAVARAQGQRALLELRGQVDSLQGAVLVQAEHTEAAAAAVTPWIDSVHVLLALRPARRPAPQLSTPTGADSSSAGPLVETGTEDLEEPLAEACRQLATHCAALRDSVVDLGLTVRRQATRIDELLATPPAPPAPTLELHTGGFHTGLAVGATGTALLVLTIALLAGH